MSLRVRLNLLITFLFLAVFIGAGSYVISNARKAVSSDVKSTARHTLQLIEVLLDSVERNGERGVQDLVLENISRLASAGHLQITVQRQSLGRQAFPPQARPAVNSEAPGWFIRLVNPPPMEFRRLIALPDMTPMEIIIHADPSDEITEVWYETRSVLFSLLLFIILVNLLLFIAIGKYLAPISAILAALQRVEQGDYKLRLPKYSLPELSSIAERINRMSDVLSQSRDENRRLTQQTLAIQEKERRHLARELHDELGQSLSAIKAIAVSIEQQSRDGYESINTSARTIGSFSERMYQVARNMMQRLRPTALDELGLLVALQEMIDDWNQRHGDVFCHFNCTDDISALGEDINISLYRIIQEGLTNIVKHSRADEVFIDLSRNGSSISLRIRDNGRGFEHSVVPRGLGLLGMQERVEVLNGDFNIDSRSGNGVCIDIVIPSRKESPGTDERKD